MFGVVAVPSCAKVCGFDALFVRVVEGGRPLFGMGRLRELDIDKTSTTLSTPPFSPAHPLCYFELVPDLAVHLAGWSPHQDAVEPRHRPAVDVLVGPGPRRRVRAPSLVQNPLDALWTQQISPNPIHILVRAVLAVELERPLAFSFGVLDLWSGLDAVALDRLQLPPPVSRTQRFRQVFGIDFSSRGALLAKALLAKALLARALPSGASFCRHDCFCL